MNIQYCEPWFIRVNGINDDIEWFYDFVKDGSGVAWPCNFEVWVLEDVF